LKSAIGPRRRDVRKVRHAIAAQNKALRFDGRRFVKGFARHRPLQEASALGRERPIVSLAWRAIHDTEVDLDFAAR